MMFAHCVCIPRLRMHNVLPCREPDEHGVAPQRWSTERFWRSSQTSSASLTRRLVLLRERSRPGATRRRASRTPRGQGERRGTGRNGGGLAAMRRRRAIRRWLRGRVGWPERQQHPNERQAFLALKTAPLVRAGGLAGRLARAMLTVSEWCVPLRCTVGFAAPTGCSMERCHRRSRQRSFAERTFGLHTAAAHPTLVRPSPPGRGLGSGAATQPSQWRGTGPAVAPSSRCGCLARVE